MEFSSLRPVLHHVWKQQDSTLTENTNTIVNQPSHKLDKSRDKESSKSTDSDILLCDECKTVKRNDHSFVLHKMDHKMNEVLKLMPENFNRLTELDCMSGVIGDTTKARFNFLLSNAKTVSTKDSNPESESSNLQSFLPNSFTNLNKEFVETVNESFQFLNFLSRQLVSQTEWGDANAPKDAKDLIKKCNVLSSVSSWVKEISDCLEKFLQNVKEEKGQKVTERETLSKLKNCHGKENENYESLSNSDSERDDVDEKIDDGEKIDSEAKNVDEYTDTQKDGVDKRSNAYFSTTRMARDLEITQRSVRIRSIGVRKYNCNMCGKGFSYKSFFQRHMQSHEESTRFDLYHQCKICSTHLMDKKGLKTHYNSQHYVGGKYQCNLCGYSVKTLKIFMDHICGRRITSSKTKRTLGNTYTCYREQGSKNEKLPLKDKHEKLKDKSIIKPVEVEYEHKNGIDQLSYYDDENTQKPRRIKKSILNKKIRTTKKRPHLCNVCEKEFACYSSLTRHKMVHRNHNNPYKCSLCSKLFRQKKTLEKHNKMAHANSNANNKLYTCALCGFQTLTASMLRNHTLELHNTDTTKTFSFSCTAYDCDSQTDEAHQLSLSQQKKTYKRKNDKRNDQNIADNENCSDDSDLHFLQGKNRLNNPSKSKSFSCPHCDFICHSNSQLKKHLKTHTIEHYAPDDDESFFCELCGFACRNKRQFNYHTLRHNNRTPFSCPDCNYKCSSASSFAGHKLKHAGLKPFLCSICGLSFAKSSHLKIHILIHNGEKSSICKTCGRAFRTRSNLKIHELIHTGQQNQHKCQMCPFECRRKTQLAHHLEREHSFTLVQSLV